MGASKFEQKQKAFEFLILGFINWHQEKNPPTNFRTEFTKLKLIKLLFFVAAIKTENGDLLDYFDNFWALPYGHVESDIYNSINDLKIFKITKEGIDDLEVPNNYFDDIEHIKLNLQNSLNEIKNANSNLIQYSAYQLVELSHKWYSWQSVFTLAKSINKQGLKIPVSMIRSEQKIYSLETADYYVSI